MLNKEGKGESIERGFERRRDGKRREGRRREGRERRRREGRERRRREGREGDRRCIHFESENVILIDKLMFNEKLLSLHKLTE